MADVTLTIDSDSAKAAQALLKMLQLQSEIDKKNKAIAGESVKLTREEAEAAKKAEMEKQRARKASEQVAKAAAAAATKANKEAELARVKAAQEAEARITKSRLQSEQVAKAAAAAAVKANQAAAAAKVRAEQDAAASMERAWHRTEKQQQTIAAERVRRAQKIARDERSIEDAVRTARDRDIASTDRQFGGLTNRIKGMPAAMMAFAASIVSVGAVASVIKGIEDRLRGVADASDSAAKALRPLTVQNAGKGGPALVKEIALMGAVEGMTPEETGTIANTIQSITGADLKTEMKNAATLRNLGVAAQDIAPIIQTGVVRGMGGGRAADLAIKASEMSAFDPAQVARFLPKTLGYTSMESGLAAGSALKEAGIIDEQLPASVEALGRVLNKDDSKLARKFKLKGLTESERVAKLSTAADASGNREEFIRRLPEKYDLGEEESRALRAVLKVGDKYGRDEAALRAVGSGYAAAKVTETLKDPLDRNEFERRRAQTVGQYQEVYGPMGERGRDMAARAQAIGLEMKQGDWPVLSALGTNQQGEANFFGRARNAVQQQGVLNMVTSPLTNNWARAGYNLAADYGLVPGAQTSQGSGEQLRRDTTEKVIADLTEALKENTEATAENSKAAGGGGSAELGATTTARVPSRNAGL